MKRLYPRRQRLSGDQRALWAKERQAIVGKLITQKGWEGFMVVEHVRGSQYLVRDPDGKEVYASHKKARRLPDGAFTKGGWALWEDRDENR
jgi:hypothetical protein